MKRNKIFNSDYLDTDISIIIPTLNEEMGIRHVIKEIIQYLEKYNYEIIVVDGGSKDDTKKIAKLYGTNVIIERQKGYGKAIKTGIYNSKGDIIIVLDGDRTYPVSNIPILINYLINDKYNFITTNRLVNFEPESMSLINFIGNKILTVMTNILFSINLYDSQSGMWLFNKRVIKQIMPISDDMCFSQEIKIRAFKNCRVLEVPIKYRPRLGKAKLKVIRDGLKNLFYLFTLRLILL